MSGPLAEAAPVLLWLLLAAGALVTLLPPGFVFLVETWSRPDFWYGPFVLAGAACLFTREARTPRPLASSSGWPGVALVLLALVGAWLGRVTEAPIVYAYVLPPALAGLLVACVGWRRAAFFAPALLLLALAFPPPGVLTLNASMVMLAGWTDLALALARFLGVPAAVDALAITFGDLSVRRAELVVGLPSAIATTAAALFLGAWFRIRPAAWLALAAASGPLVLAIGVARLAASILAAGAGDDAVALRLLDERLAVAACAAVLLGLAATIRRGRHAAEPIPPAARRPSPALAVSAVILAAAALGAQFAPERALPPLERDSLALFPEELGPWRGSRQILDAPVERTLQADEYFVANFHRPDADTYANLLISWYRDQSIGGIHSPEVCIPFDGWRIVESRMVDLTEAEAGEPMSLVRLRIRKDDQVQLVYFWIEMGGRRFASNFWARAGLIWSSVTTGRRDSALVRLITPILPSETEAEAEARLQTLLRPTLEVLPRFSPRET